MDKVSRLTAAMVAEVWDFLYLMRYPLAFGAVYLVFALLSAPGNRKRK